MNPAKDIKDRTPWRGLLDPAANLRCPTHWILLLILAVGCWAAIKWGKKDILYFSYALPILPTVLAFANAPACIRSIARREWRESISLTRIKIDSYLMQLGFTRLMRPFLMCLPCNALIHICIFWLAHTALRERIELQSRYGRISSDWMMAEYGQQKASYLLSFLLSTWILLASLLMSAVGLVLLAARHIRIQRDGRSLALRFEAFACAIGAVTFPWVVILPAVTLLTASEGDFWQSLFNHSTGVPVTLVLILTMLWLILGLGWRRLIRAFSAFK